MTFTAGSRARSAGGLSAGADPSTAGSGRSLLLDAAVLGLVLAVDLAVQYVVFPGPQRSDPEYYFYLARLFPHVVANWWSLRIGLLLLVRLPILALGPSELALYAVPVAASVLLAGSTYAIMRLLFADRVVAALAALVVVLNPSYLLDGIFVYPDPVATATFTAGFLFLILARGRPAAELRWTQSAAAVTAGVLFGWTYLVREFSPLLAPAVILALVLFRVPWRRVVMMVGATAAVFAVELIYGQARYGDPFERIHVLRTANHTGGIQEKNWAPFRAQVKTIIDGVLVLPRLLLSWNDGWAVIALVFLLVAALIRRPRRPLVALAGWLFSYWAAMAIFAIVHNKSGNSLVNVGNVRYWYPLLPALVIGGFGGLVLLVRGDTPTPGRTRLTRLCAVAIAGLILIPGTLQYNHCKPREVWRSDSAASWDGVRSWLASPAGQQFHTILTDSHSQLTITPYLRTDLGRPLWHGVISRLPQLHPPTRTGALLLVNAAEIGETQAQTYLANWAPVWVSPDSRIALLAPRHSAARPVSTAEQHRWLAGFTPPHVVPGQCGVSPYQLASG